MTKGSLCRMQSVFKQQLLSKSFCVGFFDPELWLHGHVFSIEWVDVFDVGILTSCICTLTNPIQAWVNNPHVEQLHVSVQIPSSCEISYTVTSYSDQSKRGWCNLSRIHYITHTTSPTLPTLELVGVQIPAYVPTFETNLRLKLSYIILSYIQLYTTTQSIIVYNSIIMLIVASSSL